MPKLKRSASGNQASKSAAAPSPTEAAGVAQNTETASTTDASTAAPRRSWRDVLPVHPAAEMFPRMSADELQALGDDIKKNGMTSPIAITYEKKTADSQREFFLLDGRNRLDAMTLVGIPFSIEVKAGECSIEAGGLDLPAVNMVDGNPWKYVESANVHRRHMSKAERSEALIKLIEKDPTRSNRQIAKDTGYSDKTVAAARAKAEDVRKIPNVSTRTDTKGREQPAKKPRTKPRTPEERSAARSAQLLAADATRDGDRALVATPTPAPAPSIVPPQVSDAKPTPTNYTSLLDAWHRCSPDERRKFMRHIGATFVETRTGADPFEVPQFLKRPSDNAGKEDPP